MLVFCLSVLIRIPARRYPPPTIAIVVATPPANEIRLKVYGRRAEGHPHRLDRS